MFSSSCVVVAVVVVLIVVIVVDNRHAVGYGSVPVAGVVIVVTDVVIVAVVDVDAVAVTCTVVVIVVVLLLLLLLLLLVDVFVIAVVVVVGGWHPFSPCAELPICHNVHRQSWDEEYGTILAVSGRTVSSDLCVLMCYENLAHVQSQHDPNNHSNINLKVACPFPVFATVAVFWVLAHACANNNKSKPIPAVFLLVVNAHALDDVSCVFSLQHPPHKCFDLVATVSETLSKLVSVG